MCNNVAGTGGRRINRCNGNVAGDRGRRRCDCDCVFECLLDLLEEVLEERNSRRCNCECVFDCLEDVLGNSGNNHHC